MHRTRSGQNPTHLSFPEDYEAIGQDPAESTEFMSTENILKAMVKKAKEIGADALQGSMGCRTLDTHSKRGWEPTAL